MNKQLDVIALVEDDGDIATLVTMSLEQIGGFRVTHYASGREALDGIPKSLPDLLLLDYSMPEMNGDELLTALRSNPATADIPAIFMTASVMVDHVRHLRDLGALEVFAKPFDPIGLADRIRSVWERASD